MNRLVTTKIVGSASETTWSQAQTIGYTEEHQVWSILQLSHHDESSLIDLVTIGAEVLLELEHKGQELQDTEIKKEVESLISGIAEGIEVEIMVASLRGSALTVYGKGKVEAFLARKGQLARLASTWEDGVVVKGELQDQDRVVLSSAKYIEDLGVEKFQQIIVHEEEPAELLAPLVHTQAESSGVAVIVAEVKTEKAKVAGLPWLKKLLKRDPKVSLATKEPRKMNLWIGGAILILLVFMIGVGMVRRASAGAEREFASLESSVDNKLSETLSIGDLNPERARVLLTEAKGEVEAYLGTKIRDEYKLRAEELLTEIADAEQKTFKKNEVELTSVVELSILESGLEAEKMKTDGKGNLIFLSKSGNKIVLMNLVDRSKQIFDFAGGGLVDIGVSEAKTYGLTSAGVEETLWKSETQKKVIEADEFWKLPREIEMFAGNAYIFDREQSEIWKYATLGETFSERRRWLAAGITPDLSNVVDMKISGDIWVLTSTGKLERYSRGAPVNFSMEGFPSSAEAKRLSAPSAMFVTESAVYVLENGASRVVVFGEDGKYQAQYANEEFGQASDIVVVDNKGYVIVGNTVKEFGL